MSKPPSESKGYWATGKKGDIQSVLFLTTLGATALNSSNTAALFIDIAKATISMMGIGILVDYAYRIAHLSKKEIATAVILAAVIGLLVTIYPNILVPLGKAVSQLRGS